MKIITFLLGLVLCCAAAQAEVIVVDHNEKLVGPYFFNPEGDGDATIIRQLNGLWFQLPVTFNGFGLPPQAGYEATVYFAQAGCKGQAYMTDRVFPASSLVIAATNVGGNAVIFDDIVYYPDIPAPDEPVAICSQFAEGSCQNFACTTASLAPASSFDLSTLHLEPPFRIEETQPHQ